VPYDQGVSLHAALEEAGVSNQLVTVPGGGHGGFNNREMQRIYGIIQQFLGTLNLAP
jgi:acetyl esterase/lipase